MKAIIHPGKYDLPQVLKGVYSSAVAWHFVHALIIQFSGVVSGRDSEGGKARYDLNAITYRPYRTRFASGDIPGGTTVCKIMSGE